jgi:hypothetical protein
MLAGMGALALSAVFAAPVLADEHARLEGFQEVPVVSTTGEGRCNTKFRNNARGLSLEVELSYKNLEGNVLQAHIHLA